MQVRALIQTHTRAPIDTHAHIDAHSRTHAHIDAHSLTHRRTITDAHSH